MALSFLRKRTILVLPAVLLTVNLVEVILAHKARQHVRDVRLRAAIVVLLYGAAFAAATEWLSPWLTRVLTHTRRGSLRHAGAVGLLLFYALAYGALFYAYLALEMRGPSGLLPAWLR
jgi:hypothetical protein